MNVANAKVFLTTFFTHNIYNALVWPTILRLQANFSSDLMIMLFSVNKIEN